MACVFESRGTLTRPGLDGLLWQVGGTLETGDSCLGFWSLSLIFSACASIMWSAGPRPSLCQRLYLLCLQHLFSGETTHRAGGGHLHLSPGHPRCGLQRLGGGADTPLPHTTPRPTPPPHPAMAEKRGIFCFVDLFEGRVAQRWLLAKTLKDKGRQIHVWPHWPGAPPRSGLGSCRSHSGGKQCQPEV